MWPYCANVIANRVVAAFSDRHRADAPAGEERVTHQMLDDVRRLLVVHDAAEQEMTYVRGDRVGLPAVPIECHGKAPSIRHPEVAIEAHLQIVRFAVESIGERHIVPEHPRQPCTPTLGVVGIALDLAAGPRRLRDRTVAKLN